MTVSPHDIAHVLSEALPHMQQYDEEIVVVKYGGHAMGNEAMAQSFARDIVLMEQTAINPVVVHGGGARSPHSTPPCGRAAGRRSARCSSALASSPSSPLACASPTSRRWKSSR